MKKVEWWRYVLAVPAFILLYFLAPILWMLVQSVLDLFAPKYFKQGAAWIQLCAYIVAPFFASYAAAGITKRVTPLNVGLCILGGVYSVFVATWNYLTGKNNVLTTVELAVSGVIYLVLAVKFGMEMAKQGKQDKPA